ncbi:helix-turn-helix domain-containing protein [Microbacterium sp. 13-71-7]|jgi:excisionase family DNA binding protein|uniref:helix-turn-helix domain-containing protein n=1 Tax=Microbacterium sp. 13-71-7 TaxID=1970399 RepID=UPI000BCD90E8|nr:helix-turn-helix domain-containing protein [Microbacterium sp. 13-71-7]OZB83167.1 MAG: DNA-binding protein [Microbacterium sp. 13-71-7]
MPDAPTPAVRFLALAQVAELLGVRIEEILELIMQGRLRGARLGAPAAWRVEEASIAEYLAEQAEDARRRALWRQANAASFPELWGPPIRIGD